MLNAELAAPVNEARLYGGDDILGTGRASHDDRFEVGLHHPLYAKLLRNSIEFIELEAFAAPRLRQRFEGYVEADFVPEPKAVSNGASEAVDTNRLALDAMLLDAKIEHGRGDVDYSKRRHRNARHTCATRNGNPDLGWKLRSDVMKLQGRDQADHRPRDGGGGDRQVVVLCRAGSSGQPISSRANLFESTRSCHSGQRASVDALMSYVPGPQDGLLLGQAENLADGASTLRRFAYSH